MSRIGKLPIELPKNVRTQLNNRQILIEGPHGELMCSIPEGIRVELDEKNIKVLKIGDSKSNRQKHGLIRSLLKNMVVGVSEKFEKRLQMIGVGYRAQVQGKNLTLNVGFSHPVIFTIPENIDITIENNTNLILRGIDKAEVGLLASKIRSIRPPEPYKGKGIRYSDEKVLRKAGKSGK